MLKIIFKNHNYFVFIYQERKKDILFEFPHFQIGALLQHCQDLHNKLVSQKARHYMYSGEPCLPDKVPVSVGSSDVVVYSGGVLPIDLCMC